MRPVFFYKPLRVSPQSDEESHWFLVWAPVAIAIAVIAIESTGTFSAQNTSGWLRPIFQHIFGAMSDPTWDLLHHLLRKSGHFVGYGTVGYTFLRAWLYTLSGNGVSSLLWWRLQSSALAIFSTAVVAICDEFHQSLLPSRTGTPIDVLLDTAGACTLCMLVWLVCWSMQTRGLDL